MDKSWRQTVVSAVVTGVVTGLIVGLFVWVTISRIVDEVPALQPKKSIPRGSNTSVFTPEVPGTLFPETTRR